MKKKSANQLKMSKVIICLMLLFSMVVFSGCIGQLNSIEESATIPYHGSTLLAEGVGSAGTLYCTGTIVETDQGVESIIFTWTADVIFPSNFVSGAIYWGDPWGTAQSGVQFVGAIPPGHSYAGGWEQAKGEHHIWESEFRIYENRAELSSKADGIIINSITSPNDYLSLGNIREGRFEVFSFFYSRDDSYEYCIAIKTLRFYLVHEGDEFWFESGTLHTELCYRCDTTDYTIVSEIFRRSCPPGWLRIPNMPCTDPSQSG